MGHVSPGGPWSDFTRQRSDFGMTSAFQTCATHVLVSKIDFSRLVQHSMAFPVGFPVGFSIFRLHSLQLSSRKERPLAGPHLPVPGASLHAGRQRRTGTASRFGGVVPWRHGGAHAKVGSSMILKKMVNSQADYVYIYIYIHTHTHIFEDNFLHWPFGKSLILGKNIHNYIYIYIYIFIIEEYIGKTFPFLVQKQNVEAGPYISHAQCAGCLHNDHRYDHSDLVPPPRQLHFWESLPSTPG